MSSPPREAAALGPPFVLKQFAAFFAVWQKEALEEPCGTEPTPKKGRVLFF